MTPNLFVATQTLFLPHKWFRNNKNERPTRKTEHWESPIQGIYEYIPGRGWYLVATYKDAADSTSTEDPSKEGGPVGTIQETKEIVKMTTPVPVRYSKVLKRYLLAPDYEMRKKYGTIENFHGKMIKVGFFRLDNGVAWVNCWDEEGEFIPGPYKLWCIDAGTGRFRHMRKGDDPEYQRSHPNSLANYRANSFERDADERPRSQESRSTQFCSGPGSTRDGPSVPSTRANSIKGRTPSNPASKASSRANSRRNSPNRGQRSPLIPLNEAKAALIEMAKEQAAKERARASSTEQTSEQSKRSEPQVAKPVN